MLILVLALAAPCYASSASGTVRDSNGQLLAGAVLELNGPTFRRVTSDSAGVFVFESVEQNEFHALTANLANQTFTSGHFFFQTSSDTTDLHFASSGAVSANPLMTPEFFIRRQYVDLLLREPDESGLNFWAEPIRTCGSDQSCIRQKRKDVMCAFINSTEYQERFSSVTISDFC